MNEDDLRWDDWYDFRVVESKGKLYLQREYMVTGYEEDGTYNPCIDTRWNTLSVLKDYKFSYEFNEYRAFDRPQDILKFWKIAPEDHVLFSSVYRNKDDGGEELKDFKVVYCKSELMEQFPEAMI